ncbi:MAG TPA: hypothetical protein PL196_05290 [Burkholderiaceae bacterium]|nr:hypothetical protein [Burkholderiaceae bacterium]
MFVLGMHRSGTSLASELIHATGFEVPGTPLDTLEGVNARGFWESREVVDLDERLLAGAGCTWYQVGLDLPAARWRRPEVESVSADVRSFLDASFERHDRLVIKDPRLCHLLPVWLRVIDRHLVSVRIVWISRNPLAVARSLQARDGFSQATGILLWLESFLTGMKSVAQLPCLLLDFDRLLGDPASREVLCEFVGSPMSSETWAAIADPRLAHHRIESLDPGPMAQLALACHASIGHGQRPTPDFFRSVAGLRRRFARLGVRNSELVSGLAEANAAMVESKRLAMHVGALHSKALEVIAAYDSQLAQLGAARQQIAHQERVIADRDLKIQQNVLYIAKCEARIRELDRALVAQMGELQDARALADDTHSRRERQELATQGLRERIGELETALAARDADVARNGAYIDACHRRIGELHAAMDEFSALRERLAEVESTLASRTADVAQNAQYIAACHRRIEELDRALAEFDAVRVRLAGVESALVDRDSDIARKAERIAAAEQRVRELEAALAPPAAGASPPGGL